MIIGRQGKNDSFGIYEPSHEAASKVYCVTSSGQLAMLSV